MAVQSRGWRGMKGMVLASERSKTTRYLRGGGISEGCTCSRDAGLLVNQYRRGISRRLKATIRVPGMCVLHIYTEMKALLTPFSSQPFTSSSVYLQCEKAHERRDATRKAQDMSRLKKSMVNLP